jgi:NADH-quinone oxidoreductase subunit L
VFPFAGFWSKDEIMADAWEDRPWVFGVALAGVFLTALYVGRMLVLTFAGEYRGGEEPEHAVESGHEEDEVVSQRAALVGHGGHREPHESPPLMLIPLGVLAVMAAIAGFFNLDDDVGVLVEGWLPHETEELVTHGGWKWGVVISSTVAGLAGLAVAWLVYGARVVDPDRIRHIAEPVPEILENKYYLDWLYEEFFVRMVVLGGTGWVLAMWDKYVIDGVVNGIGRGANWSADRIKLAQAGQAQLYASAMLIGVVGAIAGILIVNPP